MNTCDTCKYWLAPKSEDAFMSTFGTCGNSRLHDISGLDPDEAAVEANASCEIEEEDFDGACFRSGPKFGCIHHEPK